MNNFSKTQAMKKNWSLVDLEEKKDKKTTNEKSAVDLILEKRGIRGEKEKQKFLYPDYENDLSDPFSFSGMEKAVKIVLEKIKKKEKICIYGDYDADGVTASVLLKDVFDKIGIENFCYIPDRNNEGYGINKKAVDYIKKQGANLAITVDCGISNMKEVEYAKEKKLDFIILDHHHLPIDLPSALAVVNPKLDADQNGTKELAGVGVAFKFAQALLSRISKIDDDYCKWLLDLVCVGTIADCVCLMGENRILTKFGLIVLSKTKRVGLKQIFSVGRMNIDENNLPTSHQISFQLAPRINAAGRMDHANVAFELLSKKETDQASARVLALELESHNQHRQKVTKKIIDEVEEKLAKKEKLPFVILESSPFWEMGVVGLAAGRIAEKYHRPTFLLQKGETTSRGSARSIPEFDLMLNMEKFRHLLEKYGGHCQAAGMEIPNEKILEFVSLMEKEAQKYFSVDAKKGVRVDAKIKAEDITNNLVKELDLLEPFGNGNPKPAFLVEDMEVVDKKMLGKSENHLKIWLKSKAVKGKLFEAIGFGFGKDYSKIKKGEKIDVVFNLERNNWNGSEGLQMKIIDYEQK